MADDFSNGLNIVPLDTKSYITWKRTAGSSPAEHPFRELFQKRRDPPHESKIPPETRGPPLVYMNTVKAPRIISGPVPTLNYYTLPASSTSGPFANETIRLCDVEAFRAKTGKKISRTKVHNGAIAALNADLSGLSVSPPFIPRPVIYRFIYVIKNSIAILEAIHFDLFEPDRPDLRFIGIPAASVPNDTLEGDYFRVADADSLDNLTFAIKVDKIYPVLWEAKGVEKMTFSEDERSQLNEGLVYVLKKSAKISDSVMAISAASNYDFPIRDTLFPDEESKSEHSIVNVTSKNMYTAHLYAVEPPIPGPDPPSETDEEDEETVTDEENEERKKADEEKKERKKEAKRLFDRRSEYHKRVCTISTSSQRSSRVVSSVRALTAPEADQIEDRLGAFTGYGKPGDLKLMEELFVLGSRYRVATSSGAEANDAGEMKVDESVILKTLTDKALGPLENCRELLDCIYGRQGPVPAGLTDTVELINVTLDGEGVTLNAAQSRALHMYTDPDGPRIFCILSPPGSGKTTVAAAMTAEIAADHDEVVDRRGRIRRIHKEKGVQLLLSVQNVAVDNMGAALKKMNYGGRRVYNMKSVMRLDPYCPAPFDFLDLLKEKDLDEWKMGAVTKVREVMKKDSKGKAVMKTIRGREVPVYEEQKLTYEECLTFDMRKYENNRNQPNIILSTVEMVLQKHYTFSKLKEELGEVTRVIIDEASLLTEAALFALIRRFPNARMVLIGDEHQLPPFMYDKTILGHELAGRPALSVAMKTGRIPVVELNEVYRAPPTMIEPYNRLAYGGRLVSKKAEGEHPLSVVGLIHVGLPQLLLVDVDGREELNEFTKSLSNEKELEAVVRLLLKFPRSWAKDVMIICLYKDQKNKLQDILKTLGDLHVLDRSYTVLTVDSAQGKESPIVILLTTRTQKATDFFCSKERCNVAVSRQQKALIILGKAALLTTNKPWSMVVNGDDFTQIKGDDIK